MPVAENKYCSTPWKCAFPLRHCLFQFIVTPFPLIHNAATSIQSLTHLLKILNWWNLNESTFFMSNIRIYNSDHFVNKHSRTRTNQIYKMRSTDLVPKFLLCHLLNKLRTVSVTSPGPRSPYLCSVGSGGYHQPHGVALGSEFIPGKCHAQSQEVRRYLPFASPQSVKILQPRSLYPSPKHNQS